MLQTTYQRDINQPAFTPTQTPLQSGQSSAQTGFRRVRSEITLNANPAIRTYK